MINCCEVMLFHINLKDIDIKSTAFWSVERIPNIIYLLKLGF